MMLTMLSEGASLALSSIFPGSSLGGGGKGVELLDHVLAYCGAASIGIGWCEGGGMDCCEGNDIGVCMMGCSCRLVMKLANLVLGSKWWVGGKLVAVVARCN